MKRDVQIQYVTLLKDPSKKLDPNKVYEARQLSVDTYRNDVGKIIKITIEVDNT